MQGQVIGPREGPFAQTALERPVARVFAVVTSQFVAAREFPAAALPRTLVRLLTCSFIQIEFFFCQFLLVFWGGNLVELCKFYANQFLINIKKRLK